MPQATTVEKTDEQRRQENEIFRNPCSYDKQESNLDLLYRPRCCYISDIVERIFGLWRQALYLVHTRQREINSLIADITNSPRQKRGLGSFVGSGLAWTFDLATRRDVEQLRSLLRHVLDTTNKALSAWTISQNLVTHVYSQRYSQ